MKHNNINETSVQEIKKASVRGGIIEFSSKGFSFLIQLISTVTLARILTPEDFGIVAMAMSINLFANIFRDLGLSSAAIQKKDLTFDQQTNLFWLNVLVGIILTTLVALCAPLVASFYRLPELKTAVLLMSLSFIIYSIGAQSQAWLFKNLRFGLSTIISLTGSLVTLIVSITLALLDYSYLSIIFGTLSGAIVSSALLLFLSGFTPSWPKRNTHVMPLINFGANVTVFNFVNYFSRNLDHILIGRSFGADSLGIYSKAYQLYMLPIKFIRAPLESVAFPSMSKLNSNSLNYKNYYCNLIRLCSLVTMPIMTFLHISSENVIPIVLGNQWNEVIGIFEILCLGAIIQPVSSLRGLICLSSGNSRIYLNQGLITAIIVSLTFIISISYGIKALAWSYIIISWILFWPMNSYASKGTSINGLDIIKACSTSIVCSFLSIGLYYYFEPLFSINDNILMSLFMKFILVVFIFCSSFLFSKENKRIVISAYRYARDIILIESK